MSNKAKLVVLEGLDGSGKSTQFEMLYEYLLTNGVKLKAISFPDYNDPSSTLVKMYLNGEISDDPKEINAYAASSFYAVDRYVSFKKYWEDDYKNGSFILAARYVTSNCIYQMTKLSDDEWDEYIEWLEDYEYNRHGLPKPDKVIYLDMPIDISQKLLLKRYGGDESKKDIHESDVAYLNSCRKAAIYSAKKLGWDIVECSDNGEPKAIDEIFKDLLRIINGL